MGHGLPVQAAGAPQRRQKLQGIGQSVGKDELCVLPPLNGVLDEVKQGQDIGAKAVLFQQCLEAGILLQGQLEGSFLLRRGSGGLGKVKIPPAILVVPGRTDIIGPGPQMAVFF